MSQHRLALWVAPHTYRIYQPSETCTDPQEGDIILVSGHTFTDHLIQIGEDGLELSEPELDGYTEWNHSAFVRYARETDQMADGSHVPVGTSIVAQMGPHGHEYVTLESYTGNLYAIVNFTVSDEGRDRVLHADDDCAFVKYGWMDYPTFALNDVAVIKVDLALGDSLICSAHVALCGTNVYFFPDRPPSRSAPAHIGWWLDVKPPQR